jgi:hypothetical protein
MNYDVDTVQSNNPEAFKSFSKTFFKPKIYKQQVKKTAKKGQVMRKEQRKKMNRKTNKSVHLFKNNKKRGSQMNNSGKSHVPFHSREKRYKKLFNQKNSSPIRLMNPKVERMIYLNKKGEPMLYSAIKPKKQNRSNKSRNGSKEHNFGIYSENKKIPDVNLNNDPTSLSYQNVDLDIEFKMNRNNNKNLFYGHQNEKFGVITFKSKEMINTNSNSNSNSKIVPKKMSKLTSNCKIKTISSKNGGFSSLSSTQDFLKCDTSYPSLVLNNLNSSNSIKKEKSKNKIDSKTCYMSPIKDTEEPDHSKLIDSYESTKKNTVSNTLLNNYSKNSCTLEYNLSQDENVVESNIFESIFSFKNEQINFMKEKQKKPNMYCFDIENNINVFIGSKKKNYNKYQSKEYKKKSIDKSVHKRKTSRNEINKLGKLIEKQKKFIESKSNNKPNKLVKENYREVKNWNNNMIMEKSFDKANDIRGRKTTHKKKYVFENLLNQKTLNNPNSKYFKNQNKGTLLIKKSYNSLIRCEYDKNKKKTIQYSRKNHPLSIHKNTFGNIYKNRKSSNHDHFVLSSDYNRVNLNYGKHKHINLKLVSQKNKMNSPLVVDNDYCQLNKDLLSQERNLSQECTKGLNYRYKKNNFSNINIIRNKSEIFNRKSGKIPNHLIGKHSKKKIKYSKTKENGSFDKQQFKSLRKHKIVLVPESMVTSSDLSSVSNNKNRNKIIRKKNYSLFQRDSRMSKFGIK